MADLVERLHAYAREQGSGSWLAVTLHEAGERLTELGAEGWQTIDSGPKDGTVIWLFEPHDMGGFMFAGAVNADGVWINNLDLKVQNPTHWRPLPAPPQDNREG